MVAWISSLNPGILLAVICLLLFIEECGVPLPFAPGDLLLVICGVAIAGGLNPLLAVPALLVAVTVGAMTGRELFSRLGELAVRRLAQRLRLGRPLQRAEALVGRGGWRAVFLGRLIPGLRVHTTEVAGILAIPRRTFVTGLVPAAGIYIGIFVGLGLTVGGSAPLILDWASPFLWMGTALVVMTLGTFWLVSTALQRPIRMPL